MLHDDPKMWIKENGPNVWQLLNSKAKTQLPSALSEYCGEGSNLQIDAGRKGVSSVELCVSTLKAKCGEKEVQHKYSKDFSGLETEQQLLGLFCEIALCAFLANNSKVFQLRPSTGKGTYSDCLFKLDEYKIYGEVKRYVDPWPPVIGVGNAPGKSIPNKRSIAKAPDGKKPNDTARPRSMELRSKLCDVHKQFPNGTLNILFLFHSSFGETHKYIGQALCGDSNFLKDISDYKLEDDGLFSDDEWRNISACCNVRIDGEIGIGLLGFWLNPNASIEFPDSIIEMLKSWLGCSQDCEDLIN